MNEIFLSNTTLKSIPRNIFKLRWTFFCRMLTIYLEDHLLFKKKPIVSSDSNSKKKDDASILIKKWKCSRFTFVPTQ